MHFTLCTVICLYCSQHVFFCPTIIQLTSPEEFAFFLPFLQMLASFVPPGMAVGCCCFRCHALFNWLLPVCIFSALINTFSACFGTGSICLNLFWWKNLPGAGTLRWTQATLFFQLFEKDRDTSGTLNNMKIVKSIPKLALWCSFNSALFPVSLESLWNLPTNTWASSLKYKPKCCLIPPGRLKPSFS